MREFIDNHLPCCCMAFPEECPLHDESNRYMTQPIVHVPQDQSAFDGPIHTVREYLFDPKMEWQVVAIHDGWRPLCVRSLEHSLILACEVDTARREEREVFRLVLPGENLAKLQAQEHSDMHFLGQTFDGRYLFLLTKWGQEKELRDTGADVRRIGRLDLEPKSS